MNLEFPAFLLRTTNVTLPLKVIPQTSFCVVQTEAHRKN